MMKFGANVLQTALKGLKLAKAGNYDHVLNLKYTCRALPSCFFLVHAVNQTNGKKDRNRQRRVTSSTNAHVILLTSLPSYAYLCWPQLFFYFLSFHKMSLTTVLLIFLSDCCKI